MQERSCCFIGHRQINETEELKIRLRQAVEKLITDSNIDTFLFGSKSAFDSLCWEVVTDLKEKYPYIQRIYVRAEFPYIHKDYTDYLLESYEQTYYPQKLLGSGRAAYVQRNYEMINKSLFCVFYYNKDSFPATRKSGTKIALGYAMKQGKEIVLFP